MYQKGQILSKRYAKDNEMKINEKKPENISILNFHGNYTLENYLTIGSPVNTCP